jgi:hypothetical protein
MGLAQLADDVWPDIAQVACNQDSHFIHSARVQSMLGAAPVAQEESRFPGNANISEFKRI